jgi:hypothetical protein
MKLRLKTPFTDIKFSVTIGDIEPSKYVKETKAKQREHVEHFLKLILNSYIDERRK